MENREIVRGHLCFLPRAERDELLEKLVAEVVFGEANERHAEPLRKAFAEPRPERDPVTREELEAIVPHPGWYDGREGLDEKLFAGYLTPAYDPRRLAVRVVWSDNYEDVEDEAGAVVHKLATCFFDPRLELDLRLTAPDRVSHYEGDCGDRDAGRVEVALTFAEAVAIVTSPPQAVLARYAEAIRTLPGWVDPGIPGPADDYIDTLLARLAVEDPAETVTHVDEYDAALWAHGRTRQTRTYELDRAPQAERVGLLKALAASLWAVATPEQRAAALGARTGDSLLEKIDRATCQP